MYAFDGHKLDRHPDRVAAWLAAQPVGPITVEISPTQSCNQRCTFCAFDYRRATVSMTTHQLLHVAGEVVGRTDWPVRGVTWGGEGEPTLVKALPQAMEVVATAGVDNGLITNGTMKGLEEHLPLLAWIRFSINNLDAAKYARVHGTSPQQLTQVLENLVSCLDAKAKKYPGATIGVQAVVFEETVDDIRGMASQFKAMGCDYFVAKPYSKHPKSDHQDSFSFDTARLGVVTHELAQLSSETFHAELRTRSFEACKAQKSYDHCLAAPFFHLITADRTVWPCAQFVGDGDMALGSLAFQSWREFLVSTRRMGMLNYLAQIHETAGCRHPCRLDNHNHYLCGVTDHGRHDSFI
jgi:wyosine [tRNA(Phe)-imidazoG37] synthetase (radical SAM superfamily)